MKLASMFSGVFEPDVSQLVCSHVVGRTKSGWRAESDGEAMFKIPRLKFIYLRLAGEARIARSYLRLLLSIAALEHYAICTETLNS